MHDNGCQELSLTFSHKEEKHVHEEIQQILYSHNEEIHQEWLSKRRVTRPETVVFKTKRNIIFKGAFQKTHLLLICHKLPLMGAAV